MFSKRPRDSKKRSKMRVGLFAKVDDGTFHTYNSSLYAMASPLDVSTQARTFTPVFFASLPCLVWTGGIRNRTSTRFFFLKKRAIHVPARLCVSRAVAMTLQGPEELGEQLEEPEDLDDQDASSISPAEEITLPSGLGGDDEPEEALLLLWDRFSAWLHCICVVGFDLELGQAVEVRGPTRLL